jgi:ParB family chromosome partitioning protein
MVAAIAEVENNAREDLAFIERALFAASLEEGGYPRDTIMAALANKLPPA